MFKNKVKNSFITTDFTVNPTFWQTYMTSEWTDSNKLYSEYVSDATGGKEMNKFFVQEIHNFDRPLLKLIKSLWNEFGIRPRDFRCNFFRVLEGGNLPIHVDVKSECSFLIPVTKNTGALYVEEGTKESIVYDTLTVLNTKLPHGVEAPSQERIVFHMGIHDTKFEELNVS
jgi:hypothetical protein